MGLNYKYTILYTFVSLCLFWIVIKYGSSICMRFYETGQGREALTTFENYSQQIIPYPKDVVIDYNNLNSPLYSHTVNLPLTHPVSCQNFCGPKAQCALTREQCTSDIDCQGCNPGPTTQNECITKDVAPYDATGKLGQQGLTYSPLTSGYDGENNVLAQTYPGSKDAQIKKAYQGTNMWSDSFNKGLELYNKKRESAEKYSEDISQQIQDEDGPLTKSSYYAPKYPTTISATGEFYETTPPASNSAI
jgi:hypothetical protein